MLAGKGMIRRLRGSKGDGWSLTEPKTPKALEVRLAKLATTDERVQLLMTHPGVGVINALALGHTLGNVRRFRRKEEVVAFIGLDPLEKSSGQKKRIGQISKYGSRLARHRWARPPKRVAINGYVVSMLRLAADEAAQKQRWPRPGSYSSTVTSCCVRGSVTRSSVGGAKLACAGGQESCVATRQSLKA
jgi:hypothetical protein